MDKLQVNVNFIADIYVTFRDNDSFDSINNNNQWYATCLDRLALFHLQSTTNEAESAAELAL